MNAEWLGWLRGVGFALWGVGALTGEGIAIAGVVAVLAAELAERRAAFFSTHWRGLLSWAAFAALAVASTQWAARPLAAGSPWTAFHVGVFGLAAVATPRISPRLINALFGVMAVSGLLACAQHFAPWLGLHDPALSPLYDALQRIAPVHRSFEPGQLGGFKAGGLHFHRLKYAHSFVPLAIVFGPLARTGWRRAALAVFALGLIFAETSAAWGALTLGLMAVWAGRKQRQLSGRALAVLCLLLLSLPLVLVAFAQVPADRQIAWRQALALVQAQPWLGVGYGGYASAALAAMGGVNALHPFIHLDAHSVLLQVAAQLGVVGLALAGSLLHCFARALPAPSPAVSGLCLAFATLGIVHNLPYHPVVLAAFAFALVVARDAHVDHEARPGS